MPDGPRPTPPNRFCKLVFSGHYEETLWNNVMWLYLTGSGEITVPALNDLAGSCGAIYGERIMPHVHDVSILETCQVVLYAGGSDAFEGIASLDIAGGATGSALPANVAACISWQIAPHYRGGHPRTYIGGIPLTARDTVATFTGSFVTALSSEAAALHADLEAITAISPGITTVEHGVASFVRANAWREPPVFYRIVSATVDARIDTQRRRLGRDV